MARSVVGRGVVLRQSYFWPENQLNIWNILVLASGGTVLGVFAEFMQIQNRMRIGTPWLFPYGVTVGALTIIAVVIEVILARQVKLLPSVMLLFSFILLVLYITGLIETGIQLFGPGNVSGNCQRYVDNNQAFGVSIETLAWLQQNNICSCWYAAFSFWIIGAILFIWMHVMAAQVSRDVFKDN